MVPVLHREVKNDNSKEDTKGLKLKVFNDDVKLYLNPTEGILANENTPVWAASSDSEASEGLRYKQIPKVRLIRDRMENKRTQYKTSASLNFYNSFTLVKITIQDTSFYFY